MLWFFFPGSIDLFSQKLRAIFDWVAYFKQEIIQRILWQFFGEWKRWNDQIFISIALLETQSNSIDSNGVALDLQLYGWSALGPARKSSELFKQMLTSGRKQPRQGMTIVDTCCSTSSYQIVWTRVLKRTLLCPYLDTQAAYFINVEYLSFPCVSFVELRTFWSVIMFLYLTWKALFQINFWLYILELDKQRKSIPWVLTWILA